MLSWGRKNPSLRNKKYIVSTQNERNREMHSLGSDLDAFNKFVTEELFSLKTCVERFTLITKYHVTFIW